MVSPEPPDDLSTAEPPHGLEQLHRVRFRGYEPEIPEICVITGGRATRRVEFLRHRFVGFPPVGFWWTKSFALPFSEEGYATYLRMLPLCRRVLEGWARICVGIPFLGYILFSIGCSGLALVLPWLYVADRIRGKRALCVVHSFLARAFDITVASREFAEAFRQANQGAEIGPPAPSRGCCCVLIVLILFVLICVVPLIIGAFTRR
jgi:hypothetical protein